MTGFSIFEAANEQPNVVAFASAGRAVTYAELAERVRRIAASLASRGLLEPSPAPVALVLRATRPSLETLLTCVTYGIPALLLHPRLPEGERVALAARAGARAVLVPDTDPLPEIQRAAPEPASELDPESTLALVPTSGSSGARKLVVLSRRALAASARASAANLPLGVGDRWLLCLPLAHVGGLSVVTRSLHARSAIVPFNPGDRGLLHALTELGACLERDEVTHASFVPSVLDALLAREPAWIPPRSLRAVLLGGAATPAALLARAIDRGVPVLTTYGLTEAASQVTATPFGEAPRIEGGLVSAGRALPGIDLDIGRDGRLRVRGGTLCSGYLDAPAPFDAGGWLVTDDRARLTPAGDLFVLGRASELIVTGGENVDPTLVEAALMSAPGVLQAVVFGVADPRFGEVVACVLVAENGFDGARLSEALENRLARHEQPRKVAIAPHLPLLENGKIDRTAVRRRFEPALRDRPLEPGAIRPRPPQRP